MMISKTSISCRLSRPPIAAFTFSQKLSAGRQFFFSGRFATRSPQNFTFEKAFIFLTIFKPPALILSFVIPATGRRIFTNYLKCGWLEYVRKRYFLSTQSVILRGEDILKAFTLPPPQDKTLIKSAYVYALSSHRQPKISMRVFQIINTCGIILSNPQYSQDFQ